MAHAERGQRASFFHALMPLFVSLYPAWTYGAGVVGFASWAARPLVGSSLTSATVVFLAPVPLATGLVCVLVQKNGRSARRN